MKRVVIAICLFGALLSAGMGSHLLAPGQAHAELHRAHDEVERIAFAEGGSEELRKAVTDERLAIKSLSVSRGSARILFACSAVFTVLLVLAVMFFPAARKTDERNTRTSEETELPGGFAHL